MDPQNSTLFKLPKELRLIIFEYALEKFKSTEDRHSPTSNELLDLPPDLDFRLQRVGMLAGLVCNRIMYDEALCVYYKKNTFKLTLRNWATITGGVHDRTIRSVRQLQIQLFDGFLSPSEVPECLQFPWRNLSSDMNAILFDLLTHQRSILSKASSLESLEVFAEGVEAGSKRIIGNIINRFYQTASKLRKIVVKFPLHELESQQLRSLRQIGDYLVDRTQNIDVSKPATLKLLNGILGSASCVRWEGHPANLIGTATWQARKGMVLMSSKELEDMNTESERWEEVMSKCLHSMKIDFCEKVQSWLALTERAQVIRMRSVRRDIEQAEQVLATMEMEGP